MGTCPTGMRNNANETKVKSFVRQSELAGVASVAARLSTTRHLHVQLTDTERKLLRAGWQAMEQEAQEWAIMQGFVKMLSRSDSIRKSFHVDREASPEMVAQNPTLQEHIKRIVHFFNEAMTYINIDGGDGGLAAMCKTIGLKHNKVVKLAWGKDSFEIFVSEICSSIVGSIPAEFKKTEAQAERLYNMWEAFMMHIVAEMRASLYNLRTRGSIFVPH